MGYNGKCGMHKSAKRLAVLAVVLGLVALAGISIRSCCREFDADCAAGVAECDSLMKLRPDTVHSWTYWKEHDEFTGKTYYAAACESKSATYDGDTLAMRIILRRGKDSKDAFADIPGEKIIGDISVKSGSSDDADDIKVFESSEDEWSGRGGMIELIGYGDVFEWFGHGKKVLARCEVAGYGQMTFAFDTSGLRWKR